MEKQTEKITMKQIIWYFIIFSILGLIIETVFCYITTGVLESRKGFIWGPFCPVYGVGATILILLLNRYQNSYLKLFFVGSIAGNIIEYLLSYILESIYGMRFWDYSYLSYSLNGRICFTYSLFWGILAIILVKWIKKPIDQLISYIPNHIALHIILVTILILDGIATIWAITAFQERIKIEYQIEEKIEENNWIINIKNKIEENVFSDEIMLKTFPNLRYINEKGEECYIRELKKED